MLGTVEMLCHFDCFWLLSKSSSDVASVIRYVGFWSLVNYGSFGIKCTFDWIAQIEELIIK